MEFVRKRGYFVTDAILFNKSKAVYKCIQQETRKEFVIKWTKCEERDGSLFRQLVKEKELCINLVHPNIVKFVEVFETPITNEIGYYFYQVMELCRYDLLDWFGKNKSRSLEVCVKMINEIIAGLSYLHSMNLMHRDLKPENILISFDGICKLTDFELITKHIRTETKAHTNAVGSLLYAAPEVFTEYINARNLREGAYNLKVDVYSLGIIVMEFFTIFESEQQKSNSIKKLRKLATIDANFFENFDRSANSAYFLMLMYLIEKTREDQENRPNLSEFKQMFDINTNVIQRISSKVIQHLLIKYPVFNQIDLELINSSQFVFICKQRKEYIILLNNKNERIVYELRANKTFDTLLEKKRIVENLTNKTIIDIACGFSFLSISSYVLCLTRNSEVFEWRINSREQLENETCFDRKNTEIIEELKDKNIVGISCGVRYNVALSSDGNVFAWGLNDSGQLGIDSDEDHITTPTLMQTFPINDRKVVAISCGNSHNLALTENGSVFSWGRNEYGQCGDGSHGDIRRATRVLLENDVVIEKICCGYKHSLLLTSAGHVYSFGENSYGQLGRQSEASNQCIATKIESSVTFIDIYSNSQQDISIGLSETKKCFVWGLCGEENVFVARETPFETIAETLLFYTNSKITLKAIML